MISRPVLSALRRHGLLLLSDPVLPSVTTLVAGEPVRGSWWGHRCGHEIFAASEALAHRDDVLAVKLVLGKVTFVHRPLWPALVAVGRARSSWQMRGLSPAARSLLRRVQSAARPVAPRTRRREARELESRLLVRARDVHTEDGSHRKMLESWDLWCARSGCDVAGMEEAAARRRLEAAARSLAGPTGKGARLPWSDA